MMYGATSLEKLREALKNRIALIFLGFDFSGLFEWPGVGKLCYCFLAANTSSFDGKIIYFIAYSASDNSNPPPPMSNSPVQPIAEGRSPRKAKPIRATSNRLRRSTGTTNDASPCFNALKKQNEDRPLAMPERVMNTQVC